MMLQPVTQWATERVATLPPQWQTHLLNRWERSRKVRGDHASKIFAERDANIALRRVTDQLTGLRLPLDSSDADILAAADVLAGRAFELAGVYHDKGDLRAALSRLCAGHGVPPASSDYGDGPAIARMFDPKWWRRQLRRVHGRVLEGAAIALGYVNKARQCYVSTQTVQRRDAQLQRNAEALEATSAVNELGQEFTLAELAAKGTANKAIRRAELMTRIAGFERIATDMRHVGLFLTMTAPSRMHKYKITRAGAVVENRRYDDTTPREAHQHHVRNWSLIRAALARRDVRLYGFRVVEPNHDGTPHWHLLVFFAPGWQGDTDRQALPRVCALVRRYCLRDLGTERSAKAYRHAKAHLCDFKPMRAELGTAAGYIAKYVAKNIDGYKLDKDLFGNDAISTAQRVDAWASTWGVRQFQQVGGPPVTVWRELRRVDKLPPTAPESLSSAHAAANKITDLETGEVTGASWARYVQAQGGPHCGRKYRVRLELAPPELGEVNQYGEPASAAVLGVCVGSYVVESTRHLWTITPARSRGAVRGASRPWTCVNNCTHGPEMSKKPIAKDWAVFEHELQIARADEDRINFGAICAPAHGPGTGQVQGEPRYVDYCNSHASLG